MDPGVKPRMTRAMIDAPDVRGRVWLCRVCRATHAQI